MDVLQSHPDILGKPHAGMTGRWRLLSHVLKQQEQQQQKSETSFVWCNFFAWSFKMRKFEIQKCLKTYWVSSMILTCAHVTVELRVKNAFM